MVLAGIITSSGPEETRHHKLLLNVVRDPNELYLYVALASSFLRLIHHGLLYCAPHPSTNCTYTVYMLSIFLSFLVGTTRVLDTYFSDFLLSFHSL
jgi:hypothetical protein